MASDLTTTDLFAAFMGGSTAPYTAGQVSSAVAAANDMIERRCDQTFASTSYALWVDGPGDEYLSLEHVPVIRINRVCNSFQNGIRISNTSSDMTAAVVSINDGEMNLQVFGGANESSSQITLSSYATLALLAAAIVALGDGWAATVEQEEQPKALRPVQIFLRNSDDSSILEIPDDATECVLQDRRTGLLHRAGGWSSGAQTVYVDYTAGYATIPAALTNVANKVAADILARGKRDGGLQSESLGKYAWTARTGRGQSGILDAYTSELSPFIRWSTE